MHKKDLVDHIIDRCGTGPSTHASYHYTGSLGPMVPLRCADKQDVSKRIVFTGHSMGAALAAMTAYQLVMREPTYKNRLYLVLMGAPRFARSNFCDWLHTELRHRILQFDSLP